MPIYWNNYICRMIDLPEKSTYSLKKGVWFVFNEKNNTIIRFWMSNFNGQEKMYFNNELVSKKKNRTNFKAVHNYTHSNNEMYEINFGLKKLKRKCVLKKNETILDEITLLPNKIIKAKQRKLILVSVFLVLIAFILVYAFEQPSYFIFISVVFSWVLFLPTIFSRKEKFVFESNKEFL